LALDVTTPDKSASATGAQFLEVPRIVEHEMIIASRAINRADLPTLMVLTELEG